jgi:hypothetical protein
LPAIYAVTSRRAAKDRAGIRRGCRGEYRASVIGFVIALLASSSARLQYGRVFDLFYPATLARPLHRHHSLAALRGDKTTTLASRGGQVHRLN